MKKKLIALLLCLVLVASVAIPGTLAVGLDTAESSSEMSVAASAETASVFFGQEYANTVSVPVDGKIVLSVGCTAEILGAQWQIYAPTAGVWANIYGETGSSCAVSYAMIRSMLDGDGLAKIRCLVSVADGTAVTQEVSLAVDTSAVPAQNEAPAAEPPVVLSDTVVTPNTAEAPAAAAAPAMFSLPQNDEPSGDEPAASPAAGTVLSEAQPIGEPVFVPADTPAYYSAPVVNDTPTDSGESDADAEPAPVSGEIPANDTPTTYTILINYIFADGKQAAPSWSATVATGSTYTQDIQSPVVVGYTPDQAVVHVEASEAKTYTVTYQAAEVDFTVKHYQQNVSNDEYTLADTETKKGFTESAVGAGLAKTDYTGFYSLLYDTTTTIAADGSTVVEVYYDRYYYLMNFDLDGGYGVEPIYARYGAPISVDTPTKPGYTFEGWTPSIPAAMPADNTSYKASWKIGESGFTVVFWYENANDNGYSVAGTYKPADVAPGTEKKSEDYKNQNFTGRDTKHFTYNAAKAETVTVKGDGSTVLNVYYTRNTYTLTFLGAGTTLICAKVEHTHSSDTCCDKSHWFSCNGYGILGRCNADNCPVGYEHTHSNDCYGLTITAKYQADIHNNFPIKDGDKTIWWTVPSNCESFEPGNYLGSIDTMPGENITFTKYQSQSGAKLYYYVETLNGASGQTSYKGRNYNLYKAIDLKGSGINLTYKEEFHPILGFTQGDSNPYLPVNGSVSVQDNNYLYYTRNSYNLKFYNYNAYVDGKGGSVQYEAPLSGYNFTPEYPAGLEKNAYVFDGWYTTPGCYEGSKANLNTMTMPASDVILYAKWVPKTHTVKTYLTKVEMDEGKAPTNTWTAVPHGTAVTNPPADPVNGQYTFVGWFYISDTGEEKAFDFSMPVNRDLNLYAKWSSNTLMNYTIRYAIENADGTLTYIADDTTGSALAGSTKTFDAKTGTELNEGYQSGYFPKVSSHSLTIDIADASKNNYTFVYVAKDEVEYTVRYLDKATGEPVVVDGVPTPDKVEKTRDAVVTETFKQITGYAPDAYQKQLVLAAENNEIIFWYVKDDAHAPVRVIHWIQNIVGDGYTEYQSSTNLNGVIRTEYSEEPLTIAGFTYNGTKSNAKGTLTAEGLVLNLYYDRIEYPYEFRFVEKDSDPEKQLADSVTGSARYQAQVTQTAKTIPGYTLVSTENQAIHIAIEDGTTAVKNVKIFYYTEQTVDIKYKVVGPDGCGTLDNYQDVQLKVTTGEVKGSAPTAANGFKFVGWYKDEECTQPVDADWVKDSKLTPDKTKNYGTNEAPVMGYGAATYYAKFEYNLTTLTITKSGGNANDSFIFDVKKDDKIEFTVSVKGNGSVTIAGLIVGDTYTVTERGSWSWRYQAAEQTITLQPTGNNVTNNVTVENSLVKKFLLDGSDYRQNTYKPNGN